MRSQLFAMMILICGLLSAHAEDRAASPSGLAESPEVAVFNIAMTTSQTQEGTAATATVTVLNRKGMPVAGARVTGTWSGLTITRGSALTNAQGRATFHSNRVREKGIFNFDIGTVNAPNGTYNAALNNISHDSIATLGAGEIEHLSLGASASR